MVSERVASRSNEEHTPMAKLSLQRLLAALTVGLGLWALPASAQDLDKEEIGKIVREYLLENPEIIQEALVVLERRREEREVAARAETIQSQSTILFDSVHQSELGNPDGDVTLVEFFDYNCGFCQRAFGDLVRLLDEDKNLRVVMKEFPVLGQGSVDAARVSIAVQRLDPEKYMDFHAALLNRRGQKTQAMAIEVAEQVGVDRAAIEKALAQGDINVPIEEVYALANGLGLTGTPSYVVGDEVLMGAVGYEALRDKIAAIRKCGGTATC